MMKRYWRIKELTECTCSDDPYEDACDYCLAGRGVPGYLTDTKFKQRYTRWRPIEEAPKDAKLDYYNSFGERNNEGPYRIVGMTLLELNEWCRIFEVPLEHITHFMPIPEPPEE
jgi:hypothetical protein